MEFALKYKEDYNLEIDEELWGYGLLTVLMSCEGNLPHKLL